MDKTARRAAASAYKEQATAAGVYAVRCGDGVWVGATPTLDTLENRMRFALRMGGWKTRALQAAFTAAGEASFGFEPLERAPADLGDIGRKSWLAERAAHWRAELGAQTD